MKKTGIVALIGRTNSGKSTLINNLIGQKVSITSPKPQTTRFPIEAVYEDDRGQIIFIDTPGVFAKARDQIIKKINLKAKGLLHQDFDLICYIVDHTRSRDVEENRTIGIIRKIKRPKILVINKIDLITPSYLADYKFIEEEVDATIKISSLKGIHLKELIELIFQYLPYRKAIVNTKNLSTPLLSMDSRTFISEIIREKVFLFTRQEIPYHTTCIVEEIIERTNGALYIRGKVLTSDKHYKKMIIGRNGRMIKEIGMAVRKELEVSTNKPVYVELVVESDPHWPENYL